MPDRNPDTWLCDRCGSESLGSPIRAPVNGQLLCWACSWRVLGHRFALAVMAGLADRPTAQEDRPA